MLCLMFILTVESAYKPIGWATILLDSDPLCIVISYSKANNHPLGTSYFLSENH